jgi:hypothetical protein
MAYKDLLVHLDDGKGCAQRVDAAVGLARQHGAHLTGVYPLVEIPLLNYIREQIPEDVQARMEAEVIGILNSYFDCLVPPIERHGGEVLKFVGDGLLAIFAVADDAGAAGESALAAAREARLGMAACRSSSLQRWTCH